MYMKPGPSVLRHECPGAHTPTNRRQMLLSYDVTYSLILLTLCAITTSFHFSSKTLQFLYKQPLTMTILPNGGQQVNRCFSINAFSVMWNHRQTPTIHRIGNCWSGLNDCLVAEVRTGREYLRATERLKSLTVWVY